MWPSSSLCASRSLRAETAPTSNSSPLSASSRQMTYVSLFFFFFQAEDGIRDLTVTGVQTCALPIFFKRLGRAEMVGIVGIQLQRVDKLLADRRMSITLDSAAMHWLAERGYDPVYEIGRAAGRGRGEISVGAGSFKKKKKNKREEDAK